MQPQCNNYLLALFGKYSTIEPFVPPMQSKYYYLCIRMLKLYVSQYEPDILIIKAKPRMSVIITKIRIIWVY